LERTKKVGKFLILSDAGDGVGLALRLKLEGHEAKIKIFDPTHDEYGKGIVDCACEYSAGQTVIADCTGFGHILDIFRDQGVRIFGGSSFADKLESDRGFAEEVMHNAQIDTPKSLKAGSWDDAAKMCKKLGSGGNKVVIKPEGALSGVVPSHVASDVEDALNVLKQFEKEHSSSKIELTIQEFVEGIAVSTEGWFNGEDWAPGMFNHTIERKQFLDGDVGPSGGCTGNVVWPCDAKDPLVKETLTKLTIVLRKHRYVGAIDVNCVVNKGGVYGLEFTPRFGYDAFPTLLHSLSDFDFGSFIDDLSRGDDGGVKLSEGFGAGVRLSIPPWPNERFHNEDHISLRGFDKDAKEYFYPYGVMQDDEELKSSAGVGVLGVMNYEGRSIGQAFACVYYQIQKLKIPNLQYRTDMTEQCLKDYRELRQILTEDKEGWIGVDLDGTLAEYSDWSNEIGKPIPKMIQRVKRWITEGKEVRVFTARGSIDTSTSGKYEQLMKIHEWIEDNIGEPLEVTDRKDPFMIRLYDDRVRQVEANEGTLVTS
jgi:phosphoribosylamine---glycine ligase